MLKLSKKMVEIKIVDESPCPVCGAYSGHPTLDFPNRPKVGDENGRWWWKCCNPDCKCGMYLPETGEWETELTPEEAQKIMDKFKDE